MFTYEANAGATGTDTFDYQVTDSGGETAQATVTITIVDPGAGGNTPPTAQPVALQASPGIPVTGQLAGNDVDVGDTLTYNVVGGSEPSQGEFGNFETTNGQFVYVANADATGTDSFQYTVTDSNQAVSAPATVTITIAGSGGGGQAPVAAAPQNQLAAEPGGRLDFRLTAIDPDGAGIEKFNITKAPQQGSLQPVSAPELGEFRYTANSGANGVDEFTFTATDVDGLTSGEVTVQITINSGSGSGSGGAASPPAGDGSAAADAAKDDGGGALDPWSLLLVSMLMGAGVLRRRPFKR
jgi:hypothetical protein